MLLTNKVAKILTRTERIRCYTMETPSHKKLYVHYNHTDSCRDARWNARECYQFMYGRAWEPVVGFYSNLVNGCLSLSTMFGTEMPVSTETSILDGEIVGVSEELKLLNPKDRGGRWARLTFKIILSYHGGSFDGWQKQPDLNTVQGLVEKSLGRFVDDRKVKLLKEKSLPVEGGALVAGRTDKGVTALQQVCSFYTWREDVRSGEIMEAINNAAPGMIRVISVSKVSRAFHPNFSATWRHYLYIFPLNDGVEDQDCSGEKNNDVVSLHSQNDAQNRHLGEYIEDKHEFVNLDAEIEFDGRTKPRSFSVSRVNQLLQQLEGKTLSYKTFARDTKASRSTGPPTECFLFHARAAEAMLPSTDDLHSSQALADAGNCARGTKVMCVELIANRFLRKMVRVLVATSIREAAAGAEDDALLKLIEATCRRATAPPAPPEGLCLVDVGYREFRPENCLIP